MFGQTSLAFYIKAHLKINLIFCTCGNIYPIGNFIFFIIKYIKMKPYAIFTRNFFVKFIVIKAMLERV